jgi:hypothetical protein
MTLRSRVASSDGGYELRAQGSDREPIKPCAMNVGTTIEITAVNQAAAQAAIGVTSGGGDTAAIVFAVALG